MQKPSPTIQKIQSVNKISTLIGQLEEKRVLKVESNQIKLFPELFGTETQTKNLIKNLYTYMRISKKLKQGQILNILHLETSELLAQYDPALTNPVLLY
ncbi:hypothetical protein [Roseivirga seohaensis]|uniref:hypothetical protein n=1 Tax=Roseivirga seohaensis TaxID=1914963 RepID=UPI003BAA7A56